ncbi:uncharacterized protein METZ01_LOCUS362116, partial [marine metagenome]
RITGAGRGGADGTRALPTNRSVAGRVGLAARESGVREEEARVGAAQGGFLDAVLQFL